MHRAAGTELPHLSINTVNLSDLTSLSITPLSSLTHTFSYTCTHMHYSALSTHILDPPTFSLVTQILTNAAQLNPQFVGIKSPTAGQNLHKIPQWSFSTTGVKITQATNDIVTALCPWIIFLQQLEMYDRKAKLE